MTVRIALFSLLSDRLIMKLSFHSHMSFDLNSIKYEIIQAKIEADKAKNIFEHMK